VSGPYSSVVMDHFRRPRNAHRMPGPDVVGQAGTPGRGNFVLVYLRLSGDRVAAASLQTHGCCPAIAAGSLLVERLAGCSPRGARAFSAERIEQDLGGLPRPKRHCSTLAAEAWRRPWTRGGRVSQHERPRTDSRPRPRPRRRPARELEGSPPSPRWRCRSAPGPSPASTTACAPCALDRRAPRADRRAPGRPGAGLQARTGAARAARALRALERAKGDHQ